MYEAGHGDPDRAFRPDVEMKKQRVERKEKETRAEKANNGRNGT